MLLRQRDAGRRGFLEGDVVGEEVRELADGRRRGARRREEGAGVAVRECACVRVFLEDRQCELMTLQTEFEFGIVVVSPQKWRRSFSKRGERARAAPKQQQREEVDDLFDATFLTLSSKAMVFFLFSLHFPLTA